MENTHDLELRYHHSNQPIMIKMSQSHVFLPCSDIEKIQAGIGDKVVVFLQYSSTFVAGFVIGFFINWKLTLVVATMLPIISFLAGVISKVNCGPPKFQMCVQLLYTCNAANFPLSSSSHVRRSSPLSQ